MTNSDEGTDPDESVNWRGEFDEVGFNEGSSFKRNDNEPLFDEQFDSALARTDFGIIGIDEMIRGGFPENSVICIIGPPGTGKSIMSLEFLFEGIEHGENGLYISVEESSDSIISTAEEQSLEISQNLRGGNIGILDMNPMETANSLDKILEDLPEIVDEFGAGRLVVDSASVIEMIYNSQSERRPKMIEFINCLKEIDTTTVLTSESSNNENYQSRFGVLEYLCDLVIVLFYVRPHDFRETRLALEIMKIRDTLFTREIKPYEVTDNGIEIYRQANIF